MISNDPVSFWHENLGCALTTLSREASTGAIINHRTLKGIKPLRIGAVDAFYIVTSSTSFLLGRVEHENVERVKFIGTEHVSARKFIAEWLLNEAVGPYMIGVLGKASALSSLRLSHHITQSYFCEVGGGFGFNLSVVRDAQEKIGSLPWKKIIAPAIHQYSRLCQADQKTIDREREKMQALLIKTPELRKILPTLKVLPNSGEYTVLSWLNIEKTATAKDS